MKRMRLEVAIALVTLVIAGMGAAAHGADAPKPAPPGANLALSKFYVGPLGHQGTFPGKLLCLCCDLMPDTGKPKTCDVNGHHHVLLVEGDLHPLIAGTEEVTKQINSNELHDKQVVVTGNYYPATGIIFVDKIQAQ
jgi:hypothetical protein